MNVSFLKRGWEDYLYWQLNDKLILKKINGLIKEISSNPYEGTGKPELLKYNFAGWWSRRINLEHRLIYKIVDNEIIIMQCRYHYEG